MKIKTLEIIHDSLKRRMESQKFEYGILVNVLEKKKKEGAPENEIEMSENIVKESGDKIADIEDAIEEFENISFLL